MKKFNFVKIIGAEMDAKEKEAVKGGTTGNTCSSRGYCSATNTTVMGNKLMANLRANNPTLPTVKGDSIQTDSI